MFIWTKFVTLYQNFVLPLKVHLIGGHDKGKGRYSSYQTDTDFDHVIEEPSYLPIKNSKTI